MRCSIVRASRRAPIRATRRARERDLGQEAETAEVDAEDRDVDCPPRRCGRPCRSASRRRRAPRSDRIRAAGCRGDTVGASGGSRRARRSRSRTPRWTSRASSHPASSASTSRPRPAGLGDETYACDWHERPVSCVLMEPGADGAGTRDCLPCRRSATRSAAKRANPSASAAATTSSITRAWTAGSRTMPPLPTSAASGLELRFDQRDDVGAAARAAAARPAGCGGAR